MRFRRLFLQTWLLSMFGGDVAITINRLPHFGRLGPIRIFAHGFSGHGIALTGFAGCLMAEAVDESASL